MKIVLMNVVYDKGSTGHIVKTLFEELKSNGHDVTVLYGRGKKQNSTEIIKKTYELESKIHHLISKITGNMYGGMFFSTKRIIKTLKRIKPDVVNLHCINGYFVNISKLLKWLADNKIKTILTMHADFMMTGGCGYAVDCQKYLTSECKNCEKMHEINGRFSLNRTYKTYFNFKEAIKSFNKDKIKVTCVSPWLTERYRNSPIYKDIDVDCILNPVDDVFFTEAKENPYSTNNNVLYVTPDIHDSVKSGYLIKDLAKSRPDLNFTIICIKKVEFKHDCPNINFIGGGVSREKLRDFYYFADSVVLLSKRETFSMVVAEALCCGTKVCGFKCGGAESIAIKPYGNFVEYSNIELLSKLLTSENYSKEYIKKASFNAYNKAKITQQYLKEFEF